MSTHCEVCGASRKGDGNACTNNRCGGCHRTYCTPGGETSPGHGRRWPDDASFHTLLVAALDATGHSDRVIAVEIEVAVLTVTRWREGITLPTSNLRPSLMRDLVAIRKATR